VIETPPAATLLPVEAPPLVVVPSKLPPVGVLPVIVPSKLPSVEISVPSKLPPVEVLPVVVLPKLPPVEVPQIQAKPGPPSFFPPSYYQVPGQRPVLARTTLAPITPPVLFAPKTQVDAAKKPEEPDVKPYGFDFRNVPAHVRPMPLLGNFPIAPTGPGYYSVVDLIRGQYHKTPPKIPHARFGLMPQPIFNQDYRYLDDPNNTEKDWFDRFKRIRLGDNFMLSLHGSSWTRYMNEANSRLTNTQNDYLLRRTRIAADLWYKDYFRLYAEGIYADSTNSNLPPLPIDRTGYDFLNLFVDVKLGEFEKKPVYARVGRQELLLGSQRLVSSLEWANTRRTFEGARITRTGEKWDFDAFWLQPVIPNPSGLDAADHQQHFAGVWGTYRPDPRHLLDIYNLVYVNNNAIRQQGLDLGNFTLNTLGSRYTGRTELGYLWDVEGAMQFGTQAKQTVASAMATTGAGYHAKNLPGTPTFWAYYDFASGNLNPGGEGTSTFNPLFPFGHNYLGWVDQVGRRNIHDMNFHAFVYPTKWLTLWAQYHRFLLASSKDALYNAAGNAIRRDPTGQAGTDVGQEVDIVANIHLGKHDDLLFGYSKLFGGEFLKRTAGPGRSIDSQLFFIQYNSRW